MAIRTYESKGLSNWKLEHGKQKTFQAHQYSASYAGNNTVTVDASPLNGDKGYDFGS